MLVTNVGGAGSYCDELLRVAESVIRRAATEVESVTRDSVLIWLPLGIPPSDPRVSSPSSSLLRRTVADIVQCGLHVASD
jgi:hypothetical protein